MLQVFYEMIVAVLAVYGGYTALHELGALICKWIDSPRQNASEKERSNGKEDSPNGGTEGSDHAGRDD